MSASASAGDLYVPLSAAQLASTTFVGYKAHALATLMAAGVSVVDGIVITAKAYREFVDTNDLMQIVSGELARRREGSARAEEYWDSSQRIRAAFISSPLPEELRAALADGLASVVRAPLAVRSSAAYAKNAGPSLLRMHDSLLDVQGEDALFRTLKVVWASLYSDRALLYASELGLEPAVSAMGVVLQPMVYPRASAVVFTRHPLDSDHMVVEVTAGVEGRLASATSRPYRWVLDPDSGAVLEQLLPPQADRALIATETLKRIWQLAVDAEHAFGEPQACEIAILDDDICVMETRDINEPPNDDRRAYVAARVPENRLEDRRARIETEYLPSMWSEANALSVVDISQLMNDDLAAEASRRSEAVSHWRHVYRTVLAPFAHGQRLFGEYYARMTAPSDPFAFIQLLVRTPEEYEQRRQIVAEFGLEPPDALPPATRRAEAEKEFLASIPEGERAHAAWLLDIARASWRMRDDDDLYLDRIESEARRAMHEIERRLSSEAGEAHSALGPASAVQLEAAAAGLRELVSVRSAAPRGTVAEVQDSERPREFHGDPAGPGVGRGRARIALDLADASALEAGDVLVVDSLEPSVAVFAARASAIVERRGGMFAHGAVLAREHGLPCVTGVRDATRVLREGDLLTVDGNRGVVILEGD